MSQTASRGDGNNSGPKSSQNKAQLLEATMRNVPKLKELNYTQWKNVITNSIKNAKLWGYVDGSIEQPSEEHNNDLAKYFDEAGAVRNAILGSLEVAAQRYIEEALDPREAWLTLEKKYLTAEADADANLISIEKQLADLRLEEGGDMIEHIAEFCRLRSHLNGTRFSLDEQASISLLYRSLPSSLRQLVVTSDGTEMKDFNALCARLSYLSQNPEPEVPVDNTPTTPVEDYASWGVPGDIKAFGLTGDKNPLLEGRAAVTCRDCLLKDHEAGTPECPQYEWRKELWGEDVKRWTNPGMNVQPTSKVHKLFNYEFSEPVKVVLSFQELKLKEHLVKNLNRSHLKIPHGAQQCAILPAINGRNVVIQAPVETGKTTAAILSVVQLTSAGNDGIQAIILSPNEQKANDIQSMISSLGYNSYTSTSSRSVGDDLAQLTEGHTWPILVGTPERVLQLFRRSILHTPEIKLLVLDDLDTLVDAGFQSKISDIYRCFPRPYSVQTLATSCTLPVETLKDLETSLYIYKPLYISVDRHDEALVRVRMTHAFIDVSGVYGGKSRLLYQLIQSATSRPQVAILCDTFEEVQNMVNDWYRLSQYFRYYSTSASMQPEEHNKIVNDFRGNTLPLITTTSVRLKRRLDVWERDYFWIVNHNPPRHLINGGNDEINMIRDIERHFNIQMAELSWNGSTLC